jgi:uncharacterized membrane protein YgcG
MPVLSSDWARKTLRVKLGSALLISLAAVPSLAVAQAGGDGIACGTSYVILSGDSLSSVAARAYGDPKQYEMLLEANRDVIGQNPNAVAPGMSIAIPCLDAAGQPAPQEAAATTGEAMQAAINSTGPLETDELDALFGPVALFSDQLLTQVLIASTFPLDVVKADRFLKQEPALPAKERAAAAEQQPWDPSVHQLAAGFPELITRMAEHIDWTEQAGEAVLAQTEDVLDSIQRLRAKAQENGYLTDNDAQLVEVTNDIIYITPADPEVVYVPTYDTQVVYTTPSQVSGFYDPFYYGYDNDNWSEALAAGAIIFGGALILDEIFDGDDWDGGWHDGGSIDWDGGDINIDRGDINIGSGEISIGDGNRPQLGDGDRPNIGDGNRPGAGDRTGRPTQLPARVGGAEGSALEGRNRSIASDSASRDAARQKIETRKATSPGVANLPASRPATKAATPRPSNSAAAKARPSTTNRSPAATRSPNISKPKANRSPSSSASRSSGSSNAFKKSGGSRASAGASRGRSSSGGRSGGGRRR